MKRNEIKQALEAALDEMGIPTWLRHVKTIYSSMECTVIVEGRPHKVNVRSGATKHEVNDAVAKLRMIVATNKGQVDLEDVC